MYQQRSQSKRFNGNDLSTMGISKLTGKCLKCAKQSAVSDHILEYNCSIDFDHFDILACNTNKFRLFTKESLLIKSDQPQLNITVM